MLLVALSAYGMPSDHAAAREAGFNELVVKPAELRQVAHELAKAMGNTGEQQL